MDQNYQIFDTPSEKEAYLLTGGDIIDIDINGKPSRICITRIARGGVPQGVDIVTNLAWNLRSLRTKPLEKVKVVGKRIKMVEEDLKKGEMVIVKGKKGESMLFRFLSMKGNKMTAINPLDGQTWSLVGMEYVRLSKIMENAE
jgi:hypothetical protein